MKPDLSNFRYEPETGILYRIKGVQGVSVGPVTTVNKLGYKVVKIGGIQYLQHRLAFLFSGQEVPPQVDHVNGDRSDNRFRNLRASNVAHNARNQKVHREGVMATMWFSKQKKRWIVERREEFRKKHHGTYPTKEDATKKITALGRYYNANQLL